jgi:hypothetical protein
MKRSRLEPGITVVITIGIEETSYFQLGFFPCFTVPLLNEARELVGVAFCLGQVVIGQLAPCGLGLADQLFPLALSDIFIHSDLSYEKVFGEDLEAVCMPVLFLYKNQRLVIFGANG